VISFVFVTTHITSSRPLSRSSASNDSGFLTPEIATYATIQPEHAGYPNSHVGIGFVKQQNLYSLKKGECCLN
jgi:hypothetical protein